MARHVFSNVLERIMLLVLAFMILSDLVCSHENDDSYVSECHETLHPEVCIKSLSKYNLKNATKRSLACTISTLSLQSLDQMHKDAKSSRNSTLHCYDLCITVLNNGIDRLRTILPELLDLKENLTLGRVCDVHTWMSGTLTYHSTCSDCLDSLNVSETSSFKKLEKSKVKAGQLLSIALAFLTPLYNSSSNSSTSDHPMWSPPPPERKLLTRSLASIAPNVVVAKDGSGKYSRIIDAINAAPTSSRSRYIIYIKRGIYRENIEIPMSKTMIMLIGDGMGKTVITGSKSTSDSGNTLLSTSTIAIYGDGFLARGITFENTAGAAKGQAVAALVSADKSAFYQCTFAGFQDTLFSVSFRQFYRRCVVKGTVDFVFGNSAAVFQNTTLIARVPVLGQQNVYTAQGRTDPNQNTGFSFQKCTVDGIKQVQKYPSIYKTYLGRPWKAYSRTVFSSTFESAVLQPAGWLPWSGNFGLSTLFYGEYNCRGPGFKPSQRVSWSTQIRSASVAQQYSVDNFINAQNWLKATGFPYDTSL